MRLAFGLLILVLFAGIILLFCEKNAETLRFSVLATTDETIEYMPFVAQPGGGIKSYRGANERWIVKRLTQQLESEGIRFKRIHANEQTLLVVKE